MPELPVDYFFLPAIGLALPLRVRALVWVRWPRTGRLRAVAQAPIAAKIHQPLDVHRDLAAKIALDHIIAVDRLANLDDFRVGELRDPPLGGNMHLLADFLGLRRANAVDILKRDDDALVGRNIDAGDTGHASSPFRPKSEASRSLIPRPVEPGPCGFQKRRCPSPRRTESRGTMSAEVADVRAVFLYVNPRLAAKSSHRTCICAQAKTRSISRATSSIGAMPSIVLSWPRRR